MDRSNNMQQIDDFLKDYEYLKKIDVTTDYEQENPCKNWFLTFTFYYNVLSVITY